MHHKLRSSPSKLTRNSFGPELFQPEKRETVIPIRSLDPDELKEAILFEGDRAIVFEKPGTIEIPNGLAIKNPNITIAGQTAPSPGITLKGRIKINTYDVKIQHVKFRPGDSKPGCGESPHDCSALSIGASTNAEYDIHDVIIDHCSFSWATDEVISIHNYTKTSELHDIVIVNCIISEGLNNSIHPKGAHSCGMLVHNCQNLCLIRNIFAHNGFKNPQLSTGTNAILLNNLVYNFTTKGDNPVYGGTQIITREDPVEAALIGNVYIGGTNTPRDSTPIYIRNKGSQPSKVHLEQNIYWPYRSFSSSPIGKDDQTLLVDCNCEFEPDRVSQDFLPERVKILNWRDVQDELLRNSGARPFDRDKIDHRIIEDVRNRTGRIIDCVSETPIRYPKRRALGGNAWEIFLNQADSNFEGKYDDHYIQIVSGAGQNQERKINTYKIKPRLDISKPLKIARVTERWEIIPDATSEYVIINRCENNAGN